MSDANDKMVFECLISSQPKTQAQEILAQVMAKVLEACPPGMVLTSYEIYTESLQVIDGKLDFNSVPTTVEFKAHFKRLPEHVGLRSVK